MPLLDLPNEILVQIAKELTPKFLGNFLATNQFFFELLSPTLIKVGAHTTVTLGGSQPVLIWACERGYNKLVSRLLEAGSDIHARGLRGWNALQTAVSAEHEDVMQTLIGAGIDVNADAMYRGYTALHHAAIGRQEGVVKILLESGADVDGGYRNQSPLHWALICRRKAIAETLLEGGANANAMYRGFHKLREWDTPLHLAAGWDEDLESVITLLLEKGADWTKRNWEGNTVFHLAAGNGHMKTVLALLEEGAAIDDENYNHMTPIQLAVRAGQNEIVNLLLERGARFDVNQRDFKGETPLTHAAGCPGRADRRTIDKLLAMKSRESDLYNRADLDQVLVAVEKRKLDAIRMFLGLGALVNHQNLDGKTALYLAEGNGYGKITTLLREGGAFNITM